jgi:hypothetical protein
MAGAVISDWLAAVKSDRDRILNNIRDAIRSEGFEIHEM